MYNLAEIKKERAKKIYSFIAFNYGSVHFKDFLNKIEREDVVDLFCTNTLKCIEYKQKAAEITEYNVKVKNELLDHFMNDLNVDEFTIFKKRKSGLGWSARTVRGDMYAHWSKVFNDVQKPLPWKPMNPAEIVKQEITREISYDDEISFRITVDCSKYANVREVVNAVFDAVLNKVKEIELQKANNNKRVKQYIKFAKENYPQVKLEEFITAEQFVDAIEELAKEAYRKELEDDEEIDVTHGDGSGDCTWVVGEHRCECGNNRYYLELEGDALSGYYPYGQWC